jgi:hypothetical protein
VFPLTTMKENEDGTWTVTFYDEKGAVAGSWVRTKAQVDEYRSILEGRA